MVRYIVLFIVFILCSSIAQAQKSSDWLFDDTVLSEVNIYIDATSLDTVLNEGNGRYYEFPATFIFSKGEEVDTVSNIGFRLRGNTSRASQKKSFKVSFNTFEKGREYRGLEKMNLNGEHNDPSIMRAKLSWDIFEKADVPAPRANHVKLYINDEYYGLYINVEHIDDVFVKDRFGTDEGNLYKSLYPADLAYISEDPDDYKLSPSWASRRVYELKTNTEQDDYTDLASLISFLENSSDEEFEAELNNYINVDGVIRWMAVDILTGNWDNHWYNQNNFYLYYNPFDERFEFIPYDYDNTFGIDWLGPDWGTRDINNWKPQGQDRPLPNRIMEIDEFKNRLNFYIQKFIEEAFNEDDLFPEIDRLKELTQDAAIEDVYRTFDYGYDIGAYHASFTSELGGHVDYGLKPYITTRANSATSQLELEDITPIIRSFNHQIESIDASGNGVFNFYAEIVDETSHTVRALLGILNPLIDSVPSPLLVDDGTGVDEVAGDGIYSGQYENLFETNFIEYTIAVFDDSDEVISSSNAKTLLNSPSLDTIIINELMADNETGIQDTSGAYEDWIELYNNSDNPINLSGYFLTDNLLESNKWALPDTTIAPGNFLLIWADNDDEEGILHTNFGLNNDGERIALYTSAGGTLSIVDSVSFGMQSDDISYGRNGDGGISFFFYDTPTPGQSNGIINSAEPENDLPKSIELLQNYPNPFNPVTTISFRLNEASTISLEVFTIDGRLVQTLVNSRYSSGTHSVRFDASSLSSGMYFYRLETENQSLTKRLVLIK